MAHSPVVTRRRLGAELRRLRTESNKTIEQAADELECSPAKISRLETGRGVPNVRDVRDLLRLYGVQPDEVSHDELLELASEGQRQGWWTDSRSHGDEKLPERVGRYTALEQGANQIQGYEGDLMHGLLQTETYADAMIREFAPLTVPEDWVRAVQLRMPRQKVLNRTSDPLELRVIEGEPPRCSGRRGRCVHVSKMPHDPSDARARVTGGIPGRTRRDRRRPSPREARPTCSEES